MNNETPINLLEIVSNLRKRIEHMESWRSVESKITEHEVTARAMEFMREKGYVVSRLPVNELYDHDGIVFQEWDGIFVAEKECESDIDGVLCLVEAKHQVYAEHLTNRLAALDRFKRWLFESGHYTRDSCALFKCTHGSLLPFKHYTLQLFIGGELFQDRVLHLALNASVYCIHIERGNRFDVAEP
jgi:hypothetical protein